MNNTYTNLVFQGGGVKGIAYAGALQVLESRSILDQIEKVAMKDKLIESGKTYTEKFLDHRN